MDGRGEDQPVAPTHSGDDFFHIVLILALSFDRAGPASIARVDILSGQRDELRLDSLLPEDVERVPDGKNRVSVIVQTAGNSKNLHRFPSRIALWLEDFIRGEPDAVSIL
jgi:hypothetical protein